MLFLICRYSLCHVIYTLGIMFNILSIAVLQSVKKDFKCRKQYINITQIYNAINILTITVDSYKNHEIDFERYCLFGSVVMLL